MNKNEKNLSGYGFSFKDYIRILENPDKIGLNNGIWSAPILKGYDKNQRGYGIDINTNKKAKALTNNRPGRWLTEKEADTLMDDHINYITEAANKHIKGFSELPFRRRWALLGMLYRGDSVNKSGININEPDDLKFFKSISNYYRSKGLNARANSSDEFFNRPISKLLSMFKLKNGGYIRKMQTAAGGPIKKPIKRLKDGYRYIPNEQNGGWDRISDNSMADVFATMEFTPKKTKVGSSITRKQFVPSKIDYNPDDIVNVTRRRLYRNITPFGYHNPISRTLGAIALNQLDDTRTEENKRIKNSVPEASALDALWATYLNIPENQRRNINPKYGISKTKNGYYKFNSPGIIFNFEQDLSPHGLFGLPGRKTVMMNGILGNYTTGLGRDTKGDYIFYSDSKLNPDGTPNIKTGWDINPYSNTVDNDTEETTEEYGQYGQDKKDLSYKIGKALFGNVEDISMGLGTPVPIYDKIYLDDIYNVSGKERGGYYLPEITVTGKKK